MSLTNPKKVITEERLADFYQAILPYIGGVEVDNAISASSANPVENRVIKAALDTKAGTAVVSKSANGLAPQLPNETTTTKFLRQDGTWEVPNYPSVPSAYGSNPAMDGTASPGSSSNWAKGDHVHPTDTSRAANTSSFTQAGTRANIASGETIPTILGKISKWFADLKDLAFIAKPNDTTKFLRGDGQWVVPSGGGHNMVPTPAANLTEANVKDAMTQAALEGGINDDVISAWSLGNWSNVLTKRIVYNGTIAIGNNTIGTWLTDAQFETLKAKTAQERAVDEAAYGWWYDAHFVGLDNFDDYDLNFKLEPGKDALTLGGYMLDTDTGYICIKFGTYATVATNKVAIDVSIIKNNLSYSPQQQQ